LRGFSSKGLFSQRCEGVKKFEYVMLSGAKHLGISFKTDTLRSFAMLRMTGLADFFAPSVALGHIMAALTASLARTPIGLAYM
jgi:hypothetical protein